MQQFLPIGGRPLFNFDRALVAGGGGFIGGHLVAALLDAGVKQVRAVDIKPFGEWHQFHNRAENLVLDLRHADSCKEAVAGTEIVFNFAADMGGMGFIENNKALCMLSVLINTHLLCAAKDEGIPKYFYASSACVYNAEKQSQPSVTPLKENDAYPAMPEDGYGWEKLFSERMCHHFMEDFGLEVFTARFHNVYGPHGTWKGGREKAPAAICRKILEAKKSRDRSIEIWGTGEQTRSFTYIDDCIEGIIQIIQNQIHLPVNIGSNELVTINNLVGMVEEIAGIKLERTYNLDAPTGVNGRNSDNSLIRSLANWEPSTKLKDGMKNTYDWIEAEFNKA